MISSIKERMTIPVGLIDVLYTYFKNKDFTFFSIMTYAKQNEINEWKQALNYLLQDNAFVITRTGMLSDRYKFNNNHPVIKRFIL